MTIVRFTVQLFVSIQDATNTVRAYVVTRLGQTRQPLIFADLAVFTLQLKVGYIEKPLIAFQPVVNYQQIKGCRT